MGWEWPLATSGSSTTEERVVRASKKGGAALRLRHLLFRTLHIGALIDRTVSQIPTVTSSPTLSLLQTLEKVLLALAEDGDASSSVRYLVLLPPAAESRSDRRSCVRELLVLHLYSLRKSSLRSIHNSPRARPAKHLRHFVRHAAPIKEDLSPRAGRSVVTGACERCFH